MKGKLRMKRLSILMALFAAIAVFTSPLSHGEEKNLPPDALKRVESFFEEKINARYMEKNCEPIQYPGWEGFPLLKCRYEVKDSSGVPKAAEVILLNPSPHQLARWVVFTCLEVKGSADAEYTDRLSRHILQQSGAQFPVAGIVYEDMEGDGIFKAYPFRDGVTVKIEGFEYRCTHPLSEEEIRVSLYGNVIWSGKYARIQSTTREQYRANGGTEDVGDSTDRRKLSWLEVSRNLYQAAWGQEIGRASCRERV